MPAQKVAALCCFLATGFHLASHRALSQCPAPGNKTTWLSTVGCCFLLQPPIAHFPQEAHGGGSQEHLPVKHIHFANPGVDVRLK